MAKKPAQPVNKHDRPIRDYAIYTLSIIREMQAHPGEINQGFDLVWNIQHNLKRHFHLKFDPKSLDNTVRNAQIDADIKRLDAFPNPSLTPTDIMWTQSNLELKQKLELLRKELTEPPECSIRRQAMKFCMDQGWIATHRKERYPYQQEVNLLPVDGREEVEFTELTEAGKKALKLEFPKVFPEHVQQSPKSLTNKRTGTKTKFKANDIWPWKKESFMRRDMVAAKLKKAGAGRMRYEWITKASKNPGIVEKAALFQLLRDLNRL